MKEKLVISDEFNKPGMQACVEYVEVECLSLLTGKSSYNLEEAEQLIWAPCFGLLGLVIWNLLSWWIKKKKNPFPSLLTLWNKETKKGYRTGKALQEFPSCLCYSKESEWNINACSFSTSRYRKEPIFTSIISSSWEHTQILDDVGFGCTFPLTVRFVVRQSWHHFGIVMNNEHLTKFPQGLCSENQNQSQNSWGRLLLELC